MKRYGLRARLAILALTMVMGLCGGHALSVRASGAAPGPDIDASAVALNKDSSVDGVTTSARQKNAPSSDDIVRGLIDAYLKKLGVSEGINPDKDKTFVSAIQIVSVNTASPDFGKARALAFDRAYGSALRTYVRALGVQTSSQVVSSFFADDSTKAREFSQELSSGKSKLGAVLDKMIALGDAFTSDKLRGYGIDPDQFNAAPPDKKKVLLSDKFFRVTTERAQKSLAGVVPIQTFIGEDGKGNQSVGVVLMYSPKLQAIAEALRYGKKPTVTQQGPALSTLIPLEDPAKLYDLLGVRVLFDQNGVVVVSYAQWSNSYSGNDPRMRSRYSNAAFSQAESLANAQLSEFLNTNFSSEDEKKVGEEVEQAVIKEGKTGQVVEPESAVNIVDIVKEQSKRSTNSYLQGAAILKQWKHTTPEGHEIVGVIKTYSFANMEAAKRAGASGGAGKGPATPGGPAKGRMGQEQMDINTF